jgi:Protein of unknown function (DUF3263)
MMEVMSDRDREVLDFDALEFRHPTVRAGEIRRRFGWSAQLYAIRVAELHATAEGAYYAAVANRRRRRHRAETPV